MDNRGTGPEASTVLLVNPRARTGAQAYEQYRRSLTDRLHLVEAAAPDSPNAFLEHLERALRDGVQRIIVGGGDGTVALAAQAMVHRDAALGIIPCGTGNTFGHGLGLTSKPDLAEVLIAGRVRAVDVGVAVASEDARVFLNSLTVGVSTQLAVLVDAEAKRQLGWLAWPLRLGQALSLTPKLRVRLSNMPGWDAFPTRQLVIANGPSLAGPLGLPSPCAVDDGRLDVFCLGDGSRRAMLRVMWHLMRGSVARYGGARFRQVAAVHIETEPRMLVDVDGEMWRPTPLQARVLPGALRVLVPREKKPAAH